MAQPTLYQILSVKPQAREEEIRKAYHVLARQYHPDYNPGDSAAEGAFKAITRAYEVLSDPDRRARYDRALEEEGVVNQPQKAVQNKPIQRNETVSLVIFGSFLLLSIGFFFLDTPKGVFFLVIAIALELRNSIESLRKEIRQTKP